MDGFHLLNKLRVHSVGYDCFTASTDRAIALVVISLSKN